MRKYKKKFKIVSSLINSGPKFIQFERMSLKLEFSPFVETV